MEMKQNTNKTKVQTNKDCMMFEKTIHRDNNQAKMKSILLNQLQNELKYLDELNDNDFRDGKDPYINDKLLNNLQRISNQAARLKIYEIQKLSGLALGRRILNIQLKKKKDQRTKKLLKREEMELFFRQNRIKKFDYASLVQENLDNSRFIAKANPNGKGFIESQNSYKDYSKALAQSNFLETIKKVNHIFYENYTGINKNKSNITEVLFKIVWIVLFMFIFLGLFKRFTIFHSQDIIMIILLFLIMGILMYLSVKIYLEQPNNNNVIQQAIIDVKKYLKEINMEFSLKNTGIQWSCPNNFMYLEVIFHNGIPI